MSTMKTRLAIYGLCSVGLNYLLAVSYTHAAPQKIFAISQQQPGGLAEVPGNPSDTILLYDVTAVGTPGAANIFNNDPLFSIWLGYEIFEGEVGDEPNGVPRGNREDTSAITFNSANGTIYAAAFDSSSPGTVANPNNPDPVGDNQGDFDLYRIDYQELLNDFVTNSRPKGTIYAPPTQGISIGDETVLQSIGSPLFDGTVDGIAHNVPHPGALNSTVFMNDAILKTGELGRAQSASSFFDTRIDFVNPETLVLLENAPGTDPAGDFQIREWARVSTSPGAAVIDFDGPDNTVGNPGNPAAGYDDQQGGRNGNSVESWHATIMGRLEMDGADASEPAGWSLVNTSGTVGLWVAESDAGGDDISYFELDFSAATPTATKRTLAGSSFPTALDMDENPTVDTSTNDGEIDYLAVDREGNLVIGESGFFDTIEGSMTPPTGSGFLTAAQPRVAAVGIESYTDASGEILPEGHTASGGVIGFDSTDPWTITGSVPVPNADDTQVLGGSVSTAGNAIDATKVAYDRGTGWIYFIDSDQDFVEDIYVFDPVSGQIIYHEINGFNPGLFNQGTQVVFTRGDINGDGVVNQADVAALQAGIADPTLGGTVSAALGAEWYDLTADGLLTNADLDELNDIIGAPLPGDFDDNDIVNGADLAQWRGDFGVNAESDADGDDDSDGNDFLIWQRNLGAAAATGAAAAVPEPDTLALAAVGALVVLAGRRRQN